MYFFIQSHLMLLNSDKCHLKKVLQIFTFGSGKKQEKLKERDMDTIHLLLNQRQTNFIILPKNNKPIFISIIHILTTKFGNMFCIWVTLIAISIKIKIYNVYKKNFIFMKKLFKNFLRA